MRYYVSTFSSIDILSLVPTVYKIFIIFSDWLFIAVIIRWFTNFENLLISYNRSKPLTLVIPGFFGGTWPNPTGGQMVINALETMNKTNVVRFELSNIYGRQLLFCCDKCPIYRRSTGRIHYIYGTIIIHLTKS